MKVIENIESKLMKVNQENKKLNQDLENEMKERKDIQRKYMKLMEVDPQFVE